MKELGNHNASIRVVAIFPIIIGMLTLGHGDKHTSYVLVALGSSILFIGLWLLRSELVFYYNPNQACIVKKKKWLWFRYEEKLKLQRFSHITIGSLSSPNNKGSYFVELSISDKHGFIERATNNIRLRTFSKRDKGAKEAAHAFAHELSSLLNLEIAGTG